MSSQLRGLQSEYALLDETYHNQKRQWEGEVEVKGRDLELVHSRLEVCEKERGGLSETNDVLKNQLFQVKVFDFKGRI